MSTLYLWLVISFGVGLAVWVPIFLLLQKGERGPAFAVLLSLAAVGSTVGIVSGLSRVGVAGDVLAAALGLLGGVVVWLFAADRSKGLIVSVCAVAFSLSLFVGYLEGATRREAPESYLFWREKCIEKYTNKDILNDSRALSVMDASFGKICAQLFNNELARNLPAPAEEDEE